MNDGGNADFQCGSCRNKRRRICAKTKDRFEEWLYYIVKSVKTKEGITKKEGILRSNIAKEIALKYKFYKPINYDEIETKIFKKIDDAIDGTRCREAKKGGCIGTLWYKLNAKKYNTIKKEF